MEAGGSGIVRFLREASLEIAKTVAVATIGAVVVFLGLAAQPSTEQPFSWALGVALLAGVAVLLAISNLVRIGARWAARRRIGKARGDRLAILLPRLVGDDSSNGVRETLQECIEREFSNAVELIQWPEKLDTLEGQSNNRRQRQAEIADEWLRLTNCDLIIIGRVKASSVVSLRIGKGDIKPYVLNEVMDFPPEFSSELSAAIVNEALREAGIAFEQDRGVIPDLQLVVNRIEVLLPCVRNPLISLAYASTLSRLGQQLGERELSNRAVRLAIDTLDKSKNEIDDDELWRAYSNLTSMLISVSEYSLDNEVVDKALSYWEEARKLGLWSGGDINYAILLTIIGERDLDREALRLSLEEFKAIIDMPSSERDDETLGKAWHNMGLAYLAIFRQAGDVGALDQAASCFESALKFRPRISSPAYWAKTNNSLGNTLYERGVAKGSIDDLCECFKFFEPARDVYRAEGLSPGVIEVTHNVGVALVALGTLTSDPRKLVRAIKELEAVTEFCEDAKDRNWVKAQNTLGTANTTLAQLTNEPDFASLAMANFDEARSFVNRSEHVEEWLGITTNLARATMIYGKLSNDATTIRHAIDLFGECDIFKTGPLDHPIAPMIARGMAEAYEKYAIVAGENRYLDESLRVQRRMIGHLKGREQSSVWLEQVALLAESALLKARIVRSRPAIAYSEQALKRLRSAIDEQSVDTPRFDPQVMGPIMDSMSGEIDEIKLSIGQPDSDDTTSPARPE